MTNMIKFMIVLFTFATLPVKAAEMAKAADMPVTKNGALVQVQNSTMDPKDPLANLQTIAPGNAAVKSGEPSAISADNDHNLVLTNNAGRDLRVYVFYQEKWKDLGMLDAGQSMPFICTPGGFLSFTLKGGLFYKRHLRPTCPKQRHPPQPMGVKVIPETNA